MGTVLALLTSLKALRKPKIHLEMTISLESNNSNLINHTVTNYENELIPIFFTITNHELETPLLQRFTWRLDDTDYFQQDFSKINFSINGFKVGKEAARLTKGDYHEMSIWGYEIANEAYKYSRIQVRSATVSGCLV